MFVIALFLMLGGCHERFPDRFSLALEPGELADTDPTSLLSPSSPTQEQSSLCDGGETVSCDWLSALYISGEAQCRADNSGYDVSGCEREKNEREVLGAKPQVETVRPALRSARHVAARCNAGDPFTFQVRLAWPPSKRWVVHLEGGGACDDVAILCRTRASCSLNHENQLFHGPPFGDRQIVSAFPAHIGGVLSQRADINPMADANHVLAYYCSSDNWSGTRKRAVWTSDNSAKGFGPWYFAGHHNVMAMFESLMQRYGLDDADPETRVLFTGTSAGGVGVVVNAEHVAALFPRATKDRRFHIVVDAGTYLGRTPDGPTLGWDLPSCGQVDPKLDDEEVLTRAIKGIWGGAVGPECLKANSKSPGRCYMTSYAKDAWRDLGIPYLVQQSQLDLPWMSIYLGYAPAATTPSGVATHAYFANQLRERLEGMPWVFAGADQKIYGLGNYHTLISYDLGLTYCSLIDPQTKQCIGPRFGELLTRFLSSSANAIGERIVPKPKL